jgi:hypothetical protein
MANNEHIDPTMAWNWFFGAANYLWRNLKDYAESVQAGDPLSWTEIPPWIRQMDRIEARKRKELVEAAKLKAGEQGWLIAAALITSWLVLIDLGLWLSRS